MRKLPNVIWIPVMLVSLISCSKNQDQTATEMPRPVRTSVVTSGTNASTSAFSGEVKARHENKLSFRVAGKILARNVELGSHVLRGQTLLKLDVIQEALQLSAASADLVAAKKRQEQLELDLSRTQQLLAKNFASQAEVDQQKLALVEARAGLQAATARYDMNQNQQAFAELKAERSGVVSELLVEAGQVVAAGQPVVVVAADGERDVIVSVPESRIDEIRHARSMTITLWALPGKQFEGSLRELAPDTESATRTYQAKIAINHPDEQIRLGMTASVQTKNTLADNAIRIPMTAIYDNSGHATVWVLNRKTSQVTNRAVEIAPAQGESVLVTKGLTAGEIIIIAGVHLLHEGQKVLMPEIAP